MRLQRLTALERDKILDERKELIATVKRLKEILDNESLILGIVTDELGEIKDRYGDERKTEILDSSEEISIEDLQHAGIPVRDDAGRPGLMHNK